MPLVQLLDPLRRPEGRARHGTEADALCWAAGLAGGRWDSTGSVSTLPHLRHGRERLALERRFGLSRTRWLRADQVLPGSAEQVSSGPQAWVVLAGELHLEFRCPALGGWLQARWTALEWVAVPAGMPLRRLEAQAGPARLDELTGTASRRTEVLLLDTPGGGRCTAEVATADRRGAGGAPGQPGLPAAALMRAARVQMRRDSLAAAGRLPTVCA